MKFLIVLMLIMTGACSTHKKEKLKIEQEKSETQVTDAQSLGQSIQELIANSQTLSDQQKKDLTDILTENKKRADELSAESFKSRAILVKELLSGKATKRRVKILQKDIKRIENLRLKNTFDTVKRISSIVDKHPQLHDGLVEHMINLESRGSVGR